MHAAVARKLASFSLLLLVVISLDLVKVKEFVVPGIRRISVAQHLSQRVRYDLEKMN